MTTDQITASQALDLLRRARDTMGADFVYNPGGTGACMNTPVSRSDGDSSPQSKTGCLIGTAMKLWGGVNPDYFPDTGSVRSSFSQYLEPEATSIMSMAQVVQDSGASWGAAVVAAEQHLSEIVIMGYASPSIRTGPVAQ